jgi:hypothetical protein
MQVLIRICKDMKGKFVDQNIHGIQEVVGSIPISSTIKIKALQRFCLGFILALKILSTNYPPNNAVDTLNLIIGLFLPEGNAQRSCLGAPQFT